MGNIITFVSQYSSMSYRSLIGNDSKKQETPSKQVTVFSNIVGENVGEGLLNDFKVGQGLNDLIKLKENKNSDVKTNLIDCASIYLKESRKNYAWLTAMGLLERKILQYKCYENPSIAYSTHLRKSGDNKNRYIFLRCPFYDLYKGKFELRVYHNKLEDYPQYSTIEELKEDKSFVLSAKKVVQEVMLKQIDEILDKISQSGYDSLTTEEKEFLFKAGK